MDATSTESKNLTKTCSKCKETKTLNPELFSLLGYKRKPDKQGNSVPYYRSVCKQCIHDEYRAKKPDRSTKHGPKSYFVLHPEKKDEVLRLLKTGESIANIARITNIDAYKIRTAIKTNVIIVEENRE